MSSAKEPVTRRFGNGLTVLIKEDKSHPVVSLQYWVGTGSMNEGHWQGSGLSHLLEHLVFKGTAHFSGQELARKVQERGGHWNAYTSVNRTVYYIDGPAESWQIFLNLLTELVFFPTFPEDEMEREKEVVRREMAMYADDPDSVAYQLLMQTLYLKHPRRWPVLGERAAFETGVRGLHPEVQKMLGRLHYRTSYGQNVLQHSIEVSHIAGLMASELGLDVHAAKRAGLLHDIGKALDHEYEGTHVNLGVEFCRKYKEKEDILNAIQAHHGDVECKTLMACLVQAADAVSAARPGARRENLENYIKRLEKLEEITGTHPGVEKSYAIQAGREVRVMVRPEQVSEDQMVILARDLAKKIENELEYPGQIKVHVIRETKVVEYAK